MISRNISSTKRMDMSPPRAAPYGPPASDSCKCTRVPNGGIRASNNLRGGMLIRKNFAPLRFAGNYCILQWKTSHRGHRGSQGCEGLPPCSSVPSVVKIFPSDKTDELYCDCRRPAYRTSGGCGFCCGRETANHSFLRRRSGPSANRRTRAVEQPATQ
jgi:hypothetical protein